MGKDLAIEKIPTKPLGNTRSVPGVGRPPLCVATHIRPSMQARYFLNATQRPNLKLKPSVHLSNDMANGYVSTYCAYLSPETRMVHR